jgi:magnesium chelatase family protein
LISPLAVCITVNLAPADLPKESGRFDLPIALGILTATGQLLFDKLAEYEYAGELALTGELRAIRGALTMIYRALNSGRAFILPQANTAEASLVADGEASVDLQARAYHPVLKMVRTIADLEGDREIATKHFAEAVQYRRLNL